VVSTYNKPPIRWDLSNKLNRWEKAHPKRWYSACRAVKGTKLKTEAMELLGKLAPTIKPCSNQSFTKNKRSPILWNKQLRYGMRGGQPASYSGKEYSRMFKEIMGALTSVPRNANRSEARSKNLFSLQRKLYQHQHQQKLHRQHPHPQHQHHTPYLFNQRSLAWWANCKHRTKKQQSGLAWICLNLCTVNCRCWQLSIGRKKVDQSADAVGGWAERGKIGV